MSDPRSNYPPRRRSSDLHIDYQFRGTLWGIAKLIVSILIVLHLLIGNSDNRALGEILKMVSSNFFQSPHLKRDESYHVKVIPSVFTSHEVML